jgi:hypothetical protein
MDETAAIEDFTSGEGGSCVMAAAPEGGVLIFEWLFVYYKTPIAPVVVRSFLVYSS